MTGGMGLGAYAEGWEKCGMALKPLCSVTQVASQSVCLFATICLPFSAYSLSYATSPAICLPFSTQVTLRSLFPYAKSPRKSGGFPLYYTCCVSSLF